MALAGQLAARLLVAALLVAIVVHQGAAIVAERELLVSLAGRPNPIRELEERVGSLRADLPSRGRVGLLTEPAGGDLGQALGWLAQYALAPLVLDRNAGPGPTVAVAQAGIELDQLVVKHRWLVLRRPGPGVALVDTARSTPAREPSTAGNDTPR